MTKNANQELSFEKLRKVCDPDIFSFESTETLSPLEEVIGQDRAVRAVSFGIEIESPGYHMYALGPAGTGKTTTIKKFLERKAKDESTPSDWCYVNNFEDSGKPRALQLTPGRGCVFQDDMDRLVDELSTEVPQAFESEEYEREQEQIQEELQSQRRELFQDLEKKVQSKGFSLLQTPQGLIIAPVEDGEVLSTEQFNNLTTEKRQEIENRQGELQEEMRETMRQARRLQQEAREKVRELNREVIGFAVDHLIEESRRKYKDNEAIVDFLDSVRADILDNVEAFKKLQQDDQGSPPRQLNPLQLLQSQQQPTFDKYKVNLLVDNCDLDGAPVIVESNPTYHNLVGRIEHQAQFGALITNFMQIKCGSLHKANGGYLMVDARDVLINPFAWDALKRALKNNELKIETMGEALRSITTRTLEPEPIPLDIKVIIVGDPMLYYLLYNLDEDFQELFKVKADFTIQMEWGNEAPHKYAQFISSICKEEDLNHFSPSGVAKVVEHGSRMISHQGKLATKFGEIVDLIRQASYWADKNDHALVHAEDVTQAINERTYRSNQLEERIQEMIDESTILIDTQGEFIGQVNGLSVLPLGDYAFGRPSRITSRTHVGKAGVINIDRETELGGPIHNKGVMILAGYLGGKFAQDYPLTLSASITFEQSYQGVEGDSASSTELYALLSSLSGIPIRQDLAVTGSVNQHGIIQAIGGVNEKIEGYYDVCKMKGLTGDQGVLIPESNVKNLMLREDVIHAVKEGKFHIYPISTIDQGIELLTGKEAGECQDDGTYPENTINWMVQNRLKELAEKVKAFSHAKGENNENA